MKCRSCGTKLPNEARLCPKCGTHLRVVGHAKAAPQKWIIIVAVIAIGIAVGIAFAIG